MKHRSAGRGVPRETALAARLERLQERYNLDDRQAVQITRLLDCLAATAGAPTTVTDQVDAMDVHIADSLSGLEVNELANAAVAADLGSGAGFPALVLAVACPQSRIYAVESLARKCRFIEAMAEHAGVTNVQVVRNRAEDWADGLETCDAVTVRAVADLAVLCEYAAPLLRIGGALVAWKGSVPEAEEAAARVASAKLGLTPPAAVDVEPYPGSHSRRLYTARKVARTPAGFPRRAGMAVKRPLS